jgi:hypothetical protein
VKRPLHLLASVGGKGIEILGGPQREDDRLHDDRCRWSIQSVKR